MNEHIRKCCDGAGLDSNWKPGFDSIYGQQLEKFAELIIRECMTICKNHPSRIVSNNWNADAVAPDIVYRLSELFGVEE
jgi:hypothetical protein